MSTAHIVKCRRDSTVSCHKLHCKSFSTISTDSEVHEDNHPPRISPQQSSPVLDLDYCGNLLPELDHCVASEEEKDLDPPEWDLPLSTCCNRESVPALKLLLSP